MKTKKIFKIIAGVIIFFTLPTLLLFAGIYFSYNEDLPKGENDFKTADVLANKMLNSLNYNAYKATDYIEFSFKSRHHYKWDKSKNTCKVYWKHFMVNLNLNTPKESTITIKNQAYNGVEKSEIINKALSYFNNDTFWLVAPYKVFDNGTTRDIVITEANKKALLVTYNNGGTTPGDSYLWHFDDTGKPVKYQMWTQILPIDGIEASWNNWTTTKTGAILPTFHNLLFLGLEITNIKTSKE